MSISNNKLSKLFIDFCPVIYFHKDEPYFPADFDDILKIANIKVDSDINKNIYNYKLIEIKSENKFKHPLGKQILCKNSGIFQVSSGTYLDLIYVITFTWNGTRREHSFDKEEIVVRLKLVGSDWNLFKVFGSSHGNGMWFNKTDIKMEANRPVMYSAFESHAMYNEPRVHKRIFGFGNDTTGEDIRWEPSEFVIFNETDPKVQIYDKSNQIINPTTSYDYFLYNGNVGDNNNNQEWAGSIKYDTINLNGYYKFQGGIDNLFTGKHKEISTKIRIGIRIMCIVAWLVFIGYLIYPDITDYKSNIINTKELSLMIFLHLILVICVFITGSYLGMEVFVLNPIYEK